VTSNAGKSSRYRTYRIVRPAFTIRRSLTRRLSPSSVVFQQAFGPGWKTSPSNSKGTVVFSR
jgi:hypothetical protein